MSETWLGFLGLLLFALWSRRQGEQTTISTPPPSRTTDDAMVDPDVAYAQGPLSRSDLEKLATFYATDAGATVAVLKALCDIETANWDQRATIDPERGGQALLDYPGLAFDLAAKLVADLEATTREQGGTVEDVAARYNSGKPMASAPAKTRDVYVPRFTAAYRARVGDAGRWS